VEPVANPDTGFLLSNFGERNYCSKQFRRARMMQADLILPRRDRSVLQGLVLGLLFGVFVRLLLRATVNGHIDLFDPLAFVLVPLPLITAAFVACYLPARRAARVDPNEALRHL